MRKPTRFLFQLTGFLLGIAALVLAVYSIPLRELWAVLSNSFNLYLIACTALWILNILFQTWRWLIMLRWRKAVPFNSTLKLFILHRLANLLLPMRAGEGIRIVAARQQLGVDIPFLMATSILERVLNAAFLTVMAFALTFFIADLREYQMALLIATILLTCAVIWLVWRRRPEVPTIRDREQLLTANDQKNESLSDNGIGQQRWQNFVFQFLRGLAILKSPRLLIGTVLTSLGSWVSLWLGIFVLVQNLHPAPSAAAALNLLLFINIASLIPVTPSNIGPFQWGCILSLSYFGIGRTEAVALSLVLQAVRIVSAGLLGLYAFVVDSGLMNFNSTSRRVVETNQHLV